jgi:2-polyprenyl-3-methyl-5-hydroxy-6-metoxy-1,4-benzoquinol methylase
MTMSDLPKSIPCIAGGPPLRPYLEFPKIWKKRTDRTFSVYWSIEKKYGRLHPVPTPDELATFYADDEEYDDYLSGEQSDAAQPRTLLERILQRAAWSRDQGQEVTPEFLAKILSSRNLNICDVGCGAGIFLHEMQTLGHRVCGIDPHPAAVAALRKRGIPGFHGVAEELPAEVQHGSFDLVAMFHSLEHCVDPLLALRNCLHLVKPGGLLLIAVPNHACAGFGIYRQAWLHTDAGRHLFFFTGHFLREQISAAGCEIVQTYYSGYTRQFSRYWLEAETRSWEAVCSGTAPSQILGLPSRPTGLRAFLLLSQTILASNPDKKYDSLAILARKKLA